MILYLNNKNIISTHSQENWDIDVANHYTLYAGVTGKYFVFNLNMIC